MAMALPHRYPAQGINSQAAHLAQFCTDYFTAWNIPYRWEGRVLTAELDEQQASFLSGVIAKPMTLRLVFEQADLDENQDVELLTLGSFRLDQMIDSVTKRGRLTRQFGYTIEERDNPSEVEFVPYLFAICQLSYLSPTHHTERWAEVGCNLVNGNVFSDPYQCLMPLYRSFAPLPGSRILRRRIGYKRAFMENISDHLIGQLRQENHDWARITQTDISREVSDIQQYFSELAAELSAQSMAIGSGRENPRYKTDDEGHPVQSRLDIERNLRLQELTEGHAPQVIIRPVTMAIIYLSQAAAKSL